MGDHANPGCTSIGLSRHSEFWSASPSNRGPAYLIRDRRISSERGSLAVNDEEALNYDEFGLLEPYARHEGIVWRGRPEIERRFIPVSPGGPDKGGTDDAAQQISAVKWGTEEPELVLLHGGGQNAHTWDSVALALDRPLVAIDLPGHGHSDWRSDGDYSPTTNAAAIAAAMTELAPSPKLVVGMSLGGLTLIHLAAVRPDLVPRAVIVDITPGAGIRHQAMTKAQLGAVALIGGPPVFDSFEHMLQATAAAVPGRPIESLRTGVLHNSRRLEDGRWAWRYDRLNRTPASPESLTDLWNDVATATAPMMLVRGGNSQLVHDDDIQEFTRRHPNTRVEVVEGAGHSVQSDRATVLAGLISDFLLTPC
jgi:pimeloyl-ACP methyl ester carboxylesterase